MAGSEQTGWEHSTVELFERRTCFVTPLESTQPAAVATVEESGPKPPMRYLLTGASLGAAMFAVGKHVLAFYLSNTASVSAYGAAGSLVVILVWIYFSSAVLLFSAREAPPESLHRRNCA